MTDFETWLMDNSERIYRYWVYKRMYTPYEMDKKFSDESVYEDDTCSFGRIKEAVELPDGDILLGFENPENSPEDDWYNLNYYKLSEIALMYYPSDAEEFEVYEEE